MTFFTNFDAVHVFQQEHEELRRSLVLASRKPRVRAQIRARIALLNRLFAAHLNERLGSDFPNEEVEAIDTVHAEEILSSLSRVSWRGPRPTMSDVLRLVQTRKENVGGRPYRRVSLSEAPSQIGVT